MFIETHRGRLVLTAR